MNFSWAAGCLRSATPFKTRGRRFESPCSSNGPSSFPISSNRQSKYRAVRASASFNGSTTQQERRDREKKNHYDLLGVPCDASHEDIRIAYRRLALQIHPDVVPLHQMDCANFIFSQINGAYDTLSDPHKRKAYDETLHLLPPKVGKGFSYSVRDSRGRNWETDQCWC